VIRRLLDLLFDWLLGFYLNGVCVDVGGMLFILFVLNVFY